MARIPEDEIERVKRETDLAALIGSRGIELKRQGTNWTGLCPFHGDAKTPNLIVTPAKGLWRCMASGCGKAGNAVQFVQEFDGLSFRHAFELLAGGGAAAFKNNGKAKGSTVRKLPCPLDASAEDAGLLGEVADYYHERLAGSKAALGYLASRGLNDEGLLKRFRVGFADRTLGLHMPGKNRVNGASLRERLARLGVLRKSGHEHLNGCAVVPVAGVGGELRQLYGRRIDPKAPKDKRHLYLARPLAGVFNPAALKEREIILAESILDAMTFVRHGMDAATCTFGTANFTAELFEAIKAAGVESVRLAFDADEAGEKATEEAAERLQSAGIECHKVRFPWGADANGYAVDQGGEALKAAVRSAEWIGAGSSNSSTKAASLAAETAAKEKKAVDAPADSTPEPTRKGEHYELAFGERAYRVCGLEKNNGLEVLKVTLRLSEPGGLMHVDSLDLYRDAERRRLTDRAAEETGIEKDTIKHDLGKLLLALERLQEQRIAAPLEDDGAPELTAEEEREAMAFATAPNLVERIGDALAASGLVGERGNGLAIYLCATSRLLPKPLAAVIQSTSAAGKTTLMEAVLALFPGEEQIKYSAMTGQSLYYMAEQSLKNKVLAVVEEEGAEKASYALKLLQSEGALTIASTGKDPNTGRMETQEYHVEGPAAIVLTTTGVDIDEELMNRCLVLSVDESKAQTEAIQKAQRRAETPEGIVAAEEGNEALTLLQNFQRTLRPMKVANPFADALTFTADRTRTRRDHTKYLALIKTIALLHQHSRETIKRKTAGGRTVEMLPITIEDIEAANAIAPEVLGRSLDELPPQTRRLLEAVKAIVRERMEAGGIEQRAALFTRRDAREKIGWSVTQVRLHLDRLAELEFIATRHGRGGAAFQYELIVAADEPEGVAHIGLADTTKLRKAHNYDDHLTGKRGHLTGGDKNGVSGSKRSKPAPCNQPDGLNGTHIRNGKAFAVS